MIYSGNPLQWILSPMSNIYWSPMALLMFVNALKTRQNGHLFTDDISNCIFRDENVYISIKISLKLVLRCPINNIPALVWIMAWGWSCGKPLSEPTVVILLTPQWVKYCATWLEWQRDAQWENTSIRLSRMQERVERTQCYPWQIVSTTIFVENTLIDFPRGRYVPIHKDST